MIARILSRASVQNSCLTLEFIEQSVRNEVAPIKVHCHWQSDRVGGAESKEQTKNVVVVMERQCFAAL